MSDPVQGHEIVLSWDPAQTGDFCGVSLLRLDGPVTVREAADQANGGDGGMHRVREKKKKDDVQHAVVRHASLHNKTRARYTVAL